MADSEGQTKEETKGGSPKPDTDVAPPLITKRMCAPAVPLLVICVHQQYHF